MEGGKKNASCKNQSEFHVIFDFYPKTEEK